MGHVLGRGARRYTVSQCQIQRRGGVLRRLFCDVEKAAPRRRCGASPASRRAAGSPRFATGWRSRVERRERSSQFGSRFGPWRGTRRGGRVWRPFLATFARHWYTGKRVLDAILVPRGVFFATSKMRRNGVALRNMEHPRVRAVRFLGHVWATFWDAGRGATRSRNAKFRVAEVSCDVFFATSKKRRHGVALRNMSHPRMGVKNTRRCCFARSTRNHKKARL